MTAGVTFDTAALRAAAGERFTTATDLADWLVRVLDMPFRMAHEVTGRIVRTAEEKGCALEDLTLSDMQAVEARISQDIFDVLGIENSVSSRTSFGGTAPARVREAVAALRSRLT
jgi:argininosuccinate lyase